LKYFEIGAGALLALSLIAWLIWNRLQKCESKLVIDSEVIKDAEISKQVHALSDADLDARLEQNSKSRG
jgi:hypothetical protein